MESSAIFKWDPYTSPRCGVPYRRWNPKLLFWKHWTKQHESWLSESWDFQTATEGCFQCIQIPGQKTIQNFPWPTVRYICCKIYYLSNNLFSIFSFICINYSRLCILREANTDLLYLCPPSLVQISTITFYSSNSTV